MIVYLKLALPLLDPRSILLTKYDSVRCCEVDSQSTSPRTQTKDEDLRTAQVSRELHRMGPSSLCLPGGHHIPPITNRTRPIQPEILILPVNQVLLDQIHHLGHLEIQ